MTGNGISIKGMYRDVLIDPDRGVTYDSGWHSNTIVRHCRVLIAGFMKNESPGGIQYLAVGRGKDEWDGQWNTATPPGPPPGHGCRAGVSSCRQPYPCRTRCSCSRRGISADSLPGPGRSACLRSADQPPAGHGYPETRLPCPGRIQHLSIAGIRPFWELRRSALHDQLRQTPCHL